MARDEELGAVMAAAARDAVDDARERHAIALDFSEDSIKDVERVLAIIHQDYVGRGLVARVLRKGPTDSDLQFAAMMYGSYIGEVLCGSIDGAWEMVEGSLGVSNAKGTTFPVDKAFKRMANGSEDNIELFFATSLTHLK